MADLQVMKRVLENSTLTIVINGNGPTEASISALRHHVAFEDIHR